MALDEFNTYRNYDYQQLQIVNLFLYKLISTNEIEELNCINEYYRNKINRYY